MTQKQIDLFKKLECLKDSTTQTEKSISPDFYIQLSKNKHVKLYKSKVYREYILSFHINNSKKIVVTKSMWKIIRRNLNQIDGAFMDN